jgi:branched-subunit amino acid transport protein
MRRELVFIIAGMAAVTFLTRFGAPALFYYTGMPSWLGKWLKHVPTAVLTALIAPALSLPRGQLDLSWHNHYLLAGIVAAAVAYKSRSMILTMALGMAAMLLLRWLGP